MQLKKSRWLAHCFLLIGLFVSALAHAEMQSYGIVSDAGKWNAGTQAVRDSIVAGHVQDLVLPGDNLYDPGDTYDRVWSPWYSAGLHASIVAIGNHSAGYQQEISFFHMPGEFYTLKHGDIRWIVLNSDDEQNVAAQAAFYDKVMQEATEPYIFLTFHHPSFTVTQFHKWDEKPQFQQAMRPRLVRDQNRLTALIVGHDHIAALLNVGNLPMILSGANQEQRVRQALPPYQDGPVLVKTLWMYRGNPHWARIDVDTATKEVWLNFVDAQIKAVDCSVRLSPRPALFKNNCAQSNAL